MQYVQVLTRSLISTLPVLTLPQHFRSQLQQLITFSHPYSKRHTINIYFTSFFFVRNAYYANAILSRIRLSFTCECYAYFFLMLTCSEIKLTFTLVWKKSNPKPFFILVKYFFLSLNYLRVEFLYSIIFK